MNTKAFQKNIFFPLFFSFLTLGCLWVNTQLSANVENQIKNAIDDVSDSCKKGVEKLGNEVDTIQKYLENYSWKGMIQDKATSGVETLSYLKLNDHHKTVAVKRGEKIHGSVLCSLDAKKASLLNVYRVVIGFKGVGPQTTIGTSLGAAGGDSIEHFHLTAPSIPGFYQVRFRTSDCLLESNAMASWYDVNGNEPDATSTIGIVYVTP